MTSVMVTGASGLIGRALCQELQQQGHHVVGFHRADVQLPFTSLRLDDYATTPGADIMVHLAESPVFANNSEEETRQRNETARVLDGLFLRRPGRLIYVSSAAVYGDRGAQLRTETDVPFPIGGYARVKQENEQRVLMNGGIVIRPSNVYGPPLTPNTILSDLLEQIPGTESVTLRNLLPIRDYLYVSDAARGLAAIALSEATGIFNLCTGIGSSVRDLATCALGIAEQSDREVKASAPGQASSVQSCLVLDPEHTRKTVGFESKISLEEGLRSIMEQS